MKNCVNCGAPIVGARCEFCGTRYDITAIKSKIAEVQTPHHKHSGLRNIEAYDASKTYRNLDLVRFNGQLCVVTGGELRPYVCEGFQTVNICNAHISNASIKNAEVVSLYNAYKTMGGNAEIRRMYHGLLY